MVEYKINFNSIEWESPLRGVKFKKYTFGNKQVRLVEYTNEFIEPNWCSKGHIGYVLEGKIEIDFNGNIVQYSPGDSIFIQPGEGNQHKAKIKSETAKVFLVEDI